MFALTHTFMNPHKCTGTTRKTRRHIQPTTCFFLQPTIRERETGSVLNASTSVLPAICPIVTGEVLLDSIKTCPKACGTTQVVSSNAVPKGGIVHLVRCAALFSCFATTVGITQTLSVCQGRILTRIITVCSTSIRPVDMSSETFTFSSVVPKRKRLHDLYQVAIRGWR